MTLRSLRSSIAPAFEDGRHLPSNFAGCEASNHYAGKLHVISKSAWKDAVQEDPSLEAALSGWYKVACSATWKSFAEVRKTYGSADYVDPYTVFNIKGNAYRLIVKIEYRWQKIFVKHLLTHAEYDKGAWKE